jgi:hypothetical protein
LVQTFSRPGQPGDKYRDEDVHIVMLKMADNASLTPAEVWKGFQHVNQGASAASSWFSVSVLSLDNGTAPHAVGHHLCYDKLTSQLP